MDFWQKLKTKLKLYKICRTETILGFFKRNKFSKDSFQLSLDETELSFGDKVKGNLSIKSDVDFVIEKIWIRLTCEENSRKDHVILYYNDNLDLSDGIYVYEGFHKEFPFVLKLPSVGRETYHSIRQNVQWLMDVYIKVKGTTNAISTERGIEILVTKPTKPTIPTPPIPIKTVGEKKKVEKPRLPKMRKNR